MAIFDNLLGRDPVSLFDGDPVGFVVSQESAEIAYQTQDGALVVDDAYLGLTDTGARNFDAVATCTKVVCDTVVAVPLYSVDGQGVRVRTVFEELQESPNPYARWSTMIETLVSDLLLWGNAYLLIEYQGARATAAYALRASDVSVNFDRGTGTVRYDVNGYTFVNELDRPPRILHFLQRPRPGIPPIGRSTLESLRPVVAHGLAADRYQTNTALNGRQKYALSSKEPVTEDQQHAASEAWKRGTHGPETWNKTPVLPSGFTPVPLSMSNADMEMLNSIKLDRTRIASAFQVPPARLNEDTASYAASYQQDRSFVRNAILPILNEIRSVLHRGLLDGLPTLGVQYDIEPIMRAEPGQFAKQLAIEIKTGMRTPKQAAEMAGYDWDAENDEWAAKSGPGRPKTAGGGAADGEPPAEPPTSGQT